MPNDRTKFTVFYAWQSDRENNCNRGFIERALRDAVDRINGEAGPYDVVIDQDTRGVPGLCDIPATILEKIIRCNAFVADLTFVARSESATPKQCPNPNVLFELGFAARAIGWERLICVMNEAFGGSTEQMFDISHRRRICYKVRPDDQDKAAARRQLSKDLEVAVRAIMVHGGTVSADTKSATLREGLSHLSAAAMKAIEKCRAILSRVTNHVDDKGLLEFQDIVRAVQEEFHGTQWAPLFEDSNLEMDRIYDKWPGILRSTMERLEDARSDIRGQLNGLKLS